MKKITFTITCNADAGIYKKGTGYEVGEFFVTNKYDNEWALTHIPTGLMMGMFYRRKDVVAVIPDLEKLGDWSVIDASKLKYHVDIDKAIRIVKGTRAN